MLSATVFKTLGLACRAIAKIAATLTGQLRKETWLLIFLGCACAHTQPTTYDALGGSKKIEQIVDYFIDQIEFDRTLYNYFKDSNINRFRDKLIEQLCQVTGGPCAYSGDSMRSVHAGMNVTESDFNRTVDLLTKAMTKADVPYRLQNKVLKVLAPTRNDIIYR